MNHIVKENVIKNFARDKSDTREYTIFYLTPLSGKISLSPKWKWPYVVFMSYRAYPSFV